MKTKLFILTLLLISSFSLSGCMMKNMFSDNDSSHGMGMMGIADTKPAQHKEV